jgi:hypothetical protein
MKDWMYQCLDEKCNFTIWVGLRRNDASDIVQTGLSSAYGCKFEANFVDGFAIKTQYKCSARQTGFYEFYPATAVDCMVPTPGDNIFAQVTTTDIDTAIVYNIRLSNLTTGSVCSTFKSYTQSPNLAQWMGERASRSYDGQTKYVAGLPKFPVIKFTYPPKGLYSEGNTTSKQYLTNMMNSDAYSVSWHTMKNGTVTNAEASVTDKTTIQLKCLSSTNAVLVAQY